LDVYLINNPNRGKDIVFFLQHAFAKRGNVHKRSGIETQFTGHRPILPDPSLTPLPGTSAT
jgi:hypothetical protein